MAVGVVFFLAVALIATVLNGFGGLVMVTWVAGAVCLVFVILKLGEHAFQKRLD
jgi:hypothetical protein